MNKRYANGIPAVPLSHITGEYNMYSIEIRGT